MTTAVAVDTKWYNRGVRDGKNRTEFQRGPDGEGVEPPPVAQEWLPSEWREYLEGLEDGYAAHAPRFLRRLG